eukprot:768013-Hanusia_phi.AAC.5
MQIESNGQPGLQLLVVFSRYTIFLVARTQQNAADTGVMGILNLAEVLRCCIHVSCLSMVLSRTHRAAPLTGFRSTPPAPPVSTTLACQGWDVLGQVVPNVSKDASQRSRP